MTEFNQLLRSVSSGGQDSIGMTFTILSSSFSNHLNTSFKVATGGEATELPRPKLFIRDHGLVVLPLGRAEAEILVKLSHQTLCGHGYETLIETSV